MQNFQSKKVSTVITLSIAIITFSSILFSFSFKNSKLVNKKYTPQTELIKKEATVKNKTGNSSNLNTFTFTVEAEISGGNILDYKLKGIPKFKAAWIANYLPGSGNTGVGNTYHLNFYLYGDENELHFYVKNPNPSGATSVKYKTTVNVVYIN